jgi:hypothetical protein
MRFDDLGERRLAARQRLNVLADALLGPDHQAMLAA